MNTLRDRQTYEHNERQTDTEMIIQKHIQV